MVKTVSCTWSKLAPSSGESGALKQTNKHPHPSVLRGTKTKTITKKEIQKRERDRSNGTLDPFPAPSGGHIHIWAPSGCCKKPTSASLISHSFKWTEVIKGMASEAKDSPWGSLSDTYCSCDAQFWQFWCSRLPLVSKSQTVLKTSKNKTPTLHPLEWSEQTGSNKLLGKRETEFLWKPAWMMTRSQI